ncbi:D-2-hydroxyacid dehydrogenase [Allomuricauda sp. F6463D]|uniref:D-2-hydroxyacid dehydrogenase n=1 Tax=Allomuricauda sp. F6463D TaxID=2926409 RepID=UPI001FF66838|nr:D-2-hydroxyacid dehydrogenase [Muricauda sp. F6463D]MCK0159494.1 D-2-hydroxyacid dehydrogenase [Muricauda sp. F6463D]
MNILANDGLAQAGTNLLEKAGFEIKTTRVAQEQLANYINKNQIDVLLIRSTTKVDKKVIDDCPNLKLIGRGGVGMDNIEVKYAESKGIKVFNTPQASSGSVAELVFAHLLNGIRFLHDANRNMPLEGDSQFNQLKRSYASGIELRGKTLGIIGFGRIGQATAKMALSLGMDVLFTDNHLEETTLTLSFYDGQTINFDLKRSELKEVLSNSDFVSLHVPSQEKYLIGKTELGLMKPGSGIINTSRGGVLDEVALIEALESDHLSFAGLDVFESEPTPEIKILMNPKISLSPHVGGSTIEAQERIGIELAKKVIKLLK